MTEKLWKSTREATEDLDISRWTLARMRSDGTLQIGTHYRIKSRSGAARPSYQWNVIAITRVLNKPLEYR
ncbi:hypothetical protein KR51_00019420 [Rubidibacter lacunae KORDI 51-2]|uniref:Helix-turn-helix domain protein n=1 Tax=Rubidibacter lacunae KORDI 51-2 TaxID=582515 RepID=U5DLC0_9CHRO|nr:hypothetical protein KR51_00019420 [Rubidibacter lacunae KORDI 51-2]